MQISWRWWTLFALLAGCSGPAWALPVVQQLGTAEVGKKAEVSIAGVSSVENPFDPAQIQVDLVVTPAGGPPITVPAFWYQDYTSERVEGAEVLKPNGHPGWRARWLPSDQSRTVLVVKVERPDAQVEESAPIELAVTRAMSPFAGYVRLSAADRRSLATDDGHSLRLIGENVCWGNGQGTYDFEVWFGAMAAHGENFARIWLCPWSLNLEHGADSLNRYHLDAAWQLDRILEMAEERRLYVQLCLDHHGMFQQGNGNWHGTNNFWPVNPYNRVNGGPCAAPNDFFTGPAARANYQKRLRYLVARYGYSDRLLAWEFFNEIDNVFRSGLNEPDVIAWHRDMARWLRANDPYRHLITTSLTGSSERPDFWQLAEMDFSAYHSYRDAAPAGFLARLSQSFVERYQKPVMIGEFGVNDREWAIATDPHLRGFRQALWGAYLGGSVGTAMPWWWEGIHDDSAYPLFAALQKIVSRAGGQEYGWTPFGACEDERLPEELGAAVKGGERFDASLTVNPSWRNRFDLTGVVAIGHPLAAERSAETISSYLLGRAHEEHRRPIRVTAYFAEEGRLVAHANNAASAAEVVGLVDGKEVGRWNFGALTAPGVARPVVDQEVVIAVTPGRHTIELANVGPDWVFIDSIRLLHARRADYAGGWNFPPQVVGLRRGDRAILYLCSPWIVYPAGALRYRPPEQSSQTIHVTGWEKGARYSITWYDPISAGGLGQSDCVADSEGRLELKPPTYREDLAAVIAAK